MIAREPARVFMTAAGLLVLLSCGGEMPEPTSDSENAQTETIRPSPLILSADEGERRVWRVGGGMPFQLKVDRRNGGSPELVMGYEEIPPGVTIPTHRHLLADEIIFVHRGSGLARVGSLESPISTGATVYIPRDTSVTIQNTGSEPLAIAFVFSAPGFEEYMRDMSVPEGEAVEPISDQELAEIEESNRWHVVYENLTLPPGPE